jgi:probable phosphoglycerate mutase
VKFEKVFTSPLKRAKETAEGMGAEADPLLMEWDYGEYEGLTREEIPKGWDLFRDGAPGGESPQEVAGRADAFLKKIAALQGNVLLFSHGHFLKALTARFLQQNVEMGKHFTLSVASMSILGYERGEPVILLWNALS